MNSAPTNTHIFIKSKKGNLSGDFDALQFIAGFLNLKYLPVS